MRARDLTLARRRLYLVTTGIWGLLAVAVAFVPATEVFGRSPPVVIAHPSVSQDEMQTSVLRAIFAMKQRTWRNNEPIYVFVLQDRMELHIEFCKRVLNMFPYQLRYYWDRLVFSGTGQAPSEVSSETEMLRKVAATPGAIGYVQRSTVNDSVHVLEVR